jgi:hypothetical protein
MTSGPTGFVGVGAGTCDICFELGTHRCLHSCNDAEWGLQPM